MVEFQRFQQSKDLQDRGWIHDSDCIFYEHKISCGGPSFIKDNEGRIHWYSCGKEGLINGIYLKEINESQYVELVYENGKLVEYGLPRDKRKV